MNDYTPSDEQISEMLTAFRNAALSMNDVEHANEVLREVFNHPDVKRSMFNLIKKRGDLTDPDTQELIRELVNGGAE